MEAAQRLAGMFVQSVDDTGTDTFWTKSARALLTTLFAAAHHGRATGRHGVAVADRPGVDRTR